MQTDVVTGAFGYSGAAIARELRAAGHQVRTLTGHPRGGPGAGDIDTRPLDFGDPEALVKDLAGAHTLYCTYWVRFPHGTATRESAVTNSKVAVRRGGPRGHRAHRVRLDPARGHRLPVPVLQRQGRGRAAPRGDRRPVRHRPARHPVRLVGRPRQRRQRPGQQHRLAAAPPAGLRDRRRRRLPGPADPRRRPRPALRRTGRAHRQRHGRRGGAGRRPPSGRWSPRSAPRPAAGRCSCRRPAG